MMFQSTRGESGATLDQALLRGLAVDGGLYVPSDMPQFAVEDFAADDTLAAVANRFLAPFFAQSSLRDELRNIVDETYCFPIPLRDILAQDGRSVQVLELFHGPTAAFKDVGARFLAACLARLDTQSAHDKPLTILVATSGDTGGAVAAAFHQRPGIEVVVLFPQGRVSPRQQQQLTCWGENVRAFCVKGSFDDCQAMVKEAFADQSLRTDFRFSSANSINIGRLLPQSVYYAHSALTHFKKTGEPLSFVIPTGNLGNGVACLLARACGLPIGSIVFVSNENRTIPDYFANGEYQARASVETLASAMDVGAPSNLERMRFMFGEAESLRTQSLSATYVSDAQISAQVTADAKRFDFAWCPHSATAMFAYDHLSEAVRSTKHWALVATAHPAKFESVVEPLIGRTLDVPDQLAQLLERASNYATIEPVLGELTNALLAGR